MPLSSIIGHRHVVRLLRQAVARGRVPQSLLLAGPEGVGKRTVAIALAQAVNCPRRLETPDAGNPSLVGSDACGVCPTCVRIARGQHSDVAMIDQGEYASIKIDVLRDRLLSVVGYRPFEAARRVYIIDPADLMNDAGQDALLKTLEEPPPSAVIILVTAYPDTLHPTIQSRCRRLRFGPLSETDVEQILVERCAVSVGLAGAMAAASGGSVATALAEDSETVKDDREVALAVIIAAAARGPAVAGRLKAAEALAYHEKKRRSREAVGTRLGLVSSMLRDIGTIGAGAGADVDLANRDLAPQLSDLTRAYDLPRVTHAFGLVGEAIALLDRYVSPKILSDWVALGI